MVTATVMWKQPPVAESTMDLIVRARSGDSLALDSLCARYLPRLRRWAHGRLPVWARAGMGTEDVVQETLAHVAGRIEAFEPRHDGAFQGYLRQAVLNRIRDEIRRARGKYPEALESDQASSAPSPLEQAIGSELLDRYEAALSRVKDDDREAIIARVEMGMTWAEIAEALGKNSNESAQMTVKRALVRLAREMSHAKGV